MFYIAVITDQDSVIDVLEFDSYDERRGFMNAVESYTDEYVFPYPDDIDHGIDFETWRMVERAALEYALKNRLRVYAGVTSDRDAIRERLDDIDSHLARETKKRAALGSEPGDEPGSWLAVLKPILDCCGIDAVETVRDAQMKILEHVIHTDGRFFTAHDYDSFALKTKKRTVTVGIRGIGTRRATRRACHHGERPEKRMECIRELAQWFVDEA